MSQDGTIPSEIPREFVERYEQERTRVLRKRMAWYCFLAGCVMVLSITGGVTSLWSGDLPLEAVRPTRIELAIDVLVLLVHVVGLVLVLSAVRTRARLVVIVSWLIGLTAALVILQGPAATALGTTIFTKPGGAGQQAWNAGLESLFSVFVMHFLACLLLVLSPKEALRPLLPVLGLFVLMLVGFTEASIGVKVGLLIVSPLAGLPGMAWSWWRNRSFNERFTARVVAKKYGEVTRELSEARRVHEALFPPMVTRGSLRVHYRYEPASEIGGDFLFIRPLTVPPMERSGKMIVVVIDVTGHGVPAALAVSRLHDELSRMYADGAWTSPSEVAARLNRFVLENLSPQRVYATAAIVECDSGTGAVRYANAGHPPILLRMPGGLVKRLETTGPMLGVLESEAFEAGERREVLDVDGCVIVYTDGAIDTRSGPTPDTALGVEGVEQAARQAERGEPGGIASAIMRAVDEHRTGEPADDTLIVEMRRVAATDAAFTAAAASR